MHQIPQFVLSLESEERDTIQILYKNQGVGYLMEWLS